MLNYIEKSNNHLKAKLLIFLSILLNLKDYSNIEDKSDGVDKLNFQLNMNSSHFFIFCSHISTLYICRESLESKYHKVKSREV